MLSIGKLGTGQEMYYLEKVAEGAEDYYSGEGEVAGQWMGDAAAELGLSGEVGADQLTAMLTANNPASGEPLGLRAVGGRGPVPGFDLTFSAPKSVSLLWGLGGPVAGVEANAAHRSAVEAALGYLQQEACWTRRGAGGAEFVKGNGYLAAAFEHRSSRNGDPQLHTHVLVANATKGPDGKWTRLYHPALYEHAQTASYLYQAELRHELSRRLGVEWQEVRKGIAEIEGFADEHLREFSTRRAEILEAVGPDASARSMEVAALTGLSGVRLAISDEHQGLKAAIERVLACPWQRCTVHFVRNMHGHCRRDERGLVSAALREIFDAPDAEVARERFGSVLERFHATVPKVAELLEEAEEDLLAFYRFPAPHWPKLRSTNPLERVNREVGRRSDVVGIFPNDTSAIRLAGALLIEQNDEWLVARRYLSAESIALVLEDQGDEGREEVPALEAA